MLENIKLNTKTPILELNWVVETEDAPLGIEVELEVDVEEEVEVDVEVEDLFGSLPVAVAVG